MNKYSKVVLTRVKPKSEVKLAADYLVIGRQPVREALRSGCVSRVFLAAGQKGEPVDSIVSLARRDNVPLTVVSREELDGIVQGRGVHQGVAAEAKPFQYLSLAELLDSVKAASGQPFLILLDHLQDPQNFGSIMRTADAAGVHGIIIPAARNVKITPAVRKVAAGAAERVRVARVGNIVNTIEALKKEGYWVYGAEADGETPYYQVDYKVPLALVVGSEGKGLARLVRRSCDQVLAIPMQRETGSLNVAVAAAVLIYAAAAQREGWS